MKNIKPFDQPIYITRPILPSLERVYEKIEEIWTSKQLTNFGAQHNKLEFELKSYLKVKNLSLFCNGTIALDLACKALDLSGEVITTPFTFPATVHSLYFNNIKPVFCDVKSDDFNINPDGIEELISSKTSAIMPVHVFGHPCDVNRIGEIAKEKGLKIIYDAAHCFGVECNGDPIGSFGDISMFSFHATKIFHTLEGGALTFGDPDLLNELYLLKNFGIKNKEEVVLVGTNAKMNELQAAIGLLNLKIVDQEIAKRKILTQIYRENLKNVHGISYIEEKKDVDNNYQYFPVLITQKDFGLNRDQVHENLKKYNIFTRKYFYPLCTDYKYYSSEKIINIPNAKKVATEVLCLPIYGELKQEDIIKICEILKNLKT